MKISPVLWIVTLVLLALVPTKLGVEMNGAKRWLGVGKFAIQPAEFAKLTAVLYLAGVFAQRKPWPAQISPRRDWAHWMDTILTTKLVRSVPGVLILGAAYLIDKEPDLGTAAILAATAFAMFVFGGVSKRSIAAAVLVAIGGSYALVKQEPYRLERIENHVQRWQPDNVDDTSYQTVQSEVAMAAGGLTGVGIGNGRAKQVIPATTTDFILSTVAEEFGLLGSLAVIGLVGGVVWRLLYMAAHAPSRFGSLALYGFGAWIGIQAAVNVMMANGFLPAIGIPLPFISSGGSSLIALWCGVGMCQSALSGPVPASDSAGGAKSASALQCAVVTPRYPRIGARV